MEISKILLGFGEKNKFELTFDKLLIGGEKLTEVTIPIYFDNEHKTVFILDDVVSSGFKLWDSKTKVALSDSRLIEDIDLLIIKQSLNSKGESSTRAIPTRIPTVFKFAENATKATFSMLTGPEHLNGLEPTLIKQGANEISVKEFHPKELDFREPLFGEITLAGNFKAENVLSQTRNLLQFLTFLRGQQCGVGNLVGRTSGGELAFLLLGFSKSDQSKTQQGWYNIALQKNLPEIYSGYETAMGDEVCAKAISQAINFYRNSNVSRQASLETALITSVAALEALSNYVLEHRAFWSRSLLSSRTSLSDKLRAASAFCGIDFNILALHEEFLKLQKNKQLEDSFSSITFIRNKLVHQDPKFETKGIVLHQAWCCSQFLVELFILYLIGYRKNMVDRRDYTAWRGTTIPVPIVQRF